jgi:hypothetical protein
VSDLVLAHGGTAGFALELGLLLVPAVILFWLMRRSKRLESDEGEESGVRSGTPGEGEASDGDS